MGKHAHQNEWCSGLMAAVGGIALYLVRGGVTPTERWRIWTQRTTPPPSTGGRSAPAEPPTPAPPPLPPFVWDEAQPIIAKLTAKVGEASTVNVTVIGRPNQVVERQGVIILALRSTKAPTIPKGLPPLPSAPTSYMIFVQQKQWKKVRDAMEQPDDALIVERYPVHEPRFTGITVYATQVTTKALQGPFPTFVP